MRTIWRFLKQLLKRILPMPVHGVMREVNNVRSDMAAREGELSRQIRQWSQDTARRVTETQERQTRQLDRLGDLFASANRENLRLFLDARRERDEMAERFDRLSASFDRLSERYGRLEEQHGRLEEQYGRLEERLGRVETGLRRSETAVRDEVRSSGQLLMRRQDELLDPALYPHALKLWYWQKTGQVLDLDHPKTYNEKIQWLKLYDATPLKTRLADKFLVRKWVEETAGGSYLVPLLGVWDRFEDIPFDALPDRFVLKANHGCGWNAVVRDRARWDAEAAGKNFSVWMKTNFAFTNGFEMQYRDIPPKILAEAYMEQDGLGQLFDYKFMCFHGKVDSILVYTDRGGQMRRTFFSPAWERLAVEDAGYAPADHEIPRPRALEEMLALAEKLCQGFIHVRVDLYEVDGKVYFGEMTFTPASGIGVWGREQQRRWGDMIRLPGEAEPRPDREGEATI